jgi:hypothetical protein
MAFDLSWVFWCSWYIDCPAISLLSHLLFSPPFQTSYSHSSSKYRASQSSPHSAVTGLRERGLGGGNGLNVRMFSLGLTQTRISQLKPIMDSLLRNPNTPLPVCSRKWCGWWSSCECAAVVKSRVKFYGLSFLGFLMDRAHCEVMNKFSKLFIKTHSHCYSPVITDNQTSWITFPADKLV